MRALADRHTRWAALALLVTLAINAQVLTFGFVSDDWAMIVDNAKHLSGLDRIPAYFTGGVWSFSNMDAYDDQLYRPVWLIFQLLVYQVAGETAWAWHAASLVLHLINVGWVIVLIRKLYPDLAPPVIAMAAGFFGLHPMTTQNVGWNSGTPDLLMVGFLLAAISCCLAWTERRAGLPALFGALVAYALAQFIKEPAIALVPAVVIWEWRAGRLSSERSRFLVLGLLLLAAVYFAARGMALNQLGSGFEISARSFGRLAEYAVTYARLVVFPWEVPTFYLRHPLGGIAQAIDWALGGSVIIGLLATMRCRPPIGTLVLLAAILVTPGVMLAMHEKGAFAIRFLYPALAILAVAYAPMLGALLLRFGRPALGVGLTCALLMGLATHSELQHWQNQLSLGKRMVALEPSGAFGYILLSRHFERIGDDVGRLAALRRGFESVTTAQHKLKFGEDLGRLLASRKQHDDSISIYQQLAVEPETAAEGWVGIGNNKWAKGDLEGARKAYQHAFELSSDNLPAAFNLAIIADQMDDIHTALMAYRRVVELAKANKTYANAEARARTFLRSYGEGVNRFEKIQ